MDKPTGISFPKTRSQQMVPCILPFMEFFFISACIPICRFLTDSSASCFLQILRIRERIAHVSAIREVAIDSKMLARVETGINRAVRERLSRASRAGTQQNGSIFGSIAVAGGLLLAVGSMMK